MAVLHPHHAWAELLGLRYAGLVRASAQLAAPSSLRQTRIDFPTNQPPPPSYSFQLSTASFVSRCCRCLSTAGHGTTQQSQAQHSRGGQRSGGGLREGKGGEREEAAGEHQLQKLPPLGQGGSGGAGPLHKAPLAPILVFGPDGLLQLSGPSEKRVDASESTRAKAQEKARASTGREAREKARGSAGREAQEKARGSAGEEAKWKRGAPANKPRKITPKAEQRDQTAPKYSKAARRFFNERFREAERLSKVLASAGIASRRACEELIFAGRVSVNGAVCAVPQTPVDLVKDNIYVDGRSVPKKLPPKLYFVVNKPKGYICSNAPEGGKSNSKGEGGPGVGSKVAVSLVEEYMGVWRRRNPGVPQPRLFTVGRLDVATTGLLLITNDGEWANKVSHPSSGLTKEYIATLSSRATKRQLSLIGQGAEVDGAVCMPVVVEVVEEGAGKGEGEASQKQRLRIVVAEGRNREVRRMVEGAGLEVVALKRVRIGNMRLPRDLGLGKFKPLSAAEAEKITSDKF